MFARTALATISSAALALTAAPARAQYMMHLDPNLYMFVTMQMGSGPNTCLTGMALPDKEVDEARRPAPGVMAGYFAAAQSGGSKSASFRVSNKAQWAHSGTTATLAQIDAQRDPLALEGNRLDPDALRFVRSGDAQSAQGQWLVKGPDGAAAGLYDAVFRRDRGVWKLERLAVHGADEPVAPAMQYCTTPGDVTEFKLKSSAERILSLEKEIAKAEVRLDKARTQLASAEAALAARPGGTTQRDAVGTARRDLADREKKLADLQKSLSDARDYRSKASRDKAEIAAMTLPAAEAHRFRAFETTTAKEDAAKKAEAEAKKKAEKAARPAAGNN